VLTTDTQALTDRIEVMAADLDVELRFLPSRDEAAVLLEVDQPSLNDFQKITRVLNEYGQRRPSGWAIERPWQALFGLTASPVRYRIPQGDLPRLVSAFAVEAQRVVKDAPEVKWLRVLVIATVVGFGAGAFLTARIGYYVEAVLLVMTAVGMHWWATDLENRLGIARRLRERGVR
jgi:hypothetical protein